MKPELPKAYNAADFEKDIYEAWESQGAFKPESQKKTSGSFSIVMPPPNTTGTLHMGHASFLAYEDLMIRFERLRGKKTLYVPGTDHAAIATQNRVEKIIAQEGTTRQEMGRDKFIERTKQYVAETQGTIKKQIRAVGASCDWTRERYTFDEVSSRVVNEVFVRLYNDKLIYRGDRIVNWCPRCASALSDDEVKYVERESKFYYLHYGPIVIATARPETKFLDKVIIVHPDDQRYAQFVGKEFEVKWINGPIKAKVIADPIAEMETGSGAMTITPAHSFVDFDLAKKYNLEIVQIIGPDGKMTAAAGELAGLPAEEAREKVMKILEREGLVDHIDEHYKHNLSVCDRCDTPIQPLISKQWFIDVNKEIPNRGKSLKQLTHEAVSSGEITIVPERFTKVYFHWIDNLRDWCISRQIWWGHRIPVWYRGQEVRSEELGDRIASPAPSSQLPASNQEIYVGVTPPKGDGWIQDEDTLDTWFSSGTWTFSTLLSRDESKYKDLAEWIHNSPDLQFHPTSVLETGYDILFFWVARMVMMTEYVMETKPFNQVYLHGLIRDEHGKKMSKSSGNGIDPIPMIAKFGTDAVRLSLIIGATPGNDLSLSETKIGGYRNFVNKLWNISRFILTSVDEVKLITEAPEGKSMADRWILQRLHQTIETVTAMIEKKQFSLAAENLYSFTWSELADWYLEIAKVLNRTNPAEKKMRDDVILYVLQNLLKLWHPFTPFVTEVIWKQFETGAFLMLDSWPKKEARSLELEVGEEMQQLQEIITSLRNARSEHKIAPAVITKVKHVGQHEDSIEDWKNIIETLARVKFVDSLESKLELKGTWFRLLTDIAAPVQEINHEEVLKYIRTLEDKLANKEFVERAPAQVIAETKKKLVEAKGKLE